MMYQITKGLITQKIDHDTVIFDAENSMLYSLNETASYIFNLLKKHKSIDEITEKIVKKYEVSATKAKKDVVSLLSDLKKKKIIIEEIRSKK